MKRSNLPALRLRLFEERDWPEIFDTLRSIAAEGETFTYPVDLSDAVARQIWLTPPPGRTCVIVDEHDRVLGSAKMGPNQMGPGSHVATASFAVKSSERGRGIGRALVQEALRWASAQGFSAMQFNAVVESNTAALKLWTSEGFEVIGRVPDGYRHSSLGFVDLLVLHRRL